MKYLSVLFSALAALQLAMPAQAASRLGQPTMIALCGDGAPIPLPMKDHEPDKQCCKICHSAMRKRFAAGTCCDGDDDEEDSGQ